MPRAQALRVVAFDSDDDPLAELRELAQGQYIRWYLADLEAKAVLVEPAYFDRDYLSEFAAFYCTSTAGYPNVCRRVHYFDADVDRTALERALAGDEDERARLERAYLGFIISVRSRRPLSGARSCGRIQIKRPACLASSIPFGATHRTWQAFYFASTV